MKITICTFVGLGLISSPCWALSIDEVRALIEKHYPGARITEIEKERYQGKKIIEVDFTHQDIKLEAIIGLNGEIIKVQIDD